MPQPIRSNPAPGGLYPLAGREVARVGYGALQLRNVDSKTAEALLRRALDLGINHIDTAEFYGDGSVNRTIAKVVPRDGGVMIAAKVGGVPDTGSIPVKLAQRPEQLRSSLDANLRSLGVDHIALVNLRRADVGPGLKAEGDQVVDIDDQLATMVALRDEGKIGAIGLSAVDAERLRRALPAGIACVQNSYNLISREAEPLLQLCLAHQIAWVPFFPLGGGSPSAPKVVDRPEVKAAAARLRETPLRVGLAWLLRHAPNILLIPGTTSLEHLEQNVTVGSLDIDDETTSELDAVGEPTAT